MTDLTRDKARAWLLEEARKGQLPFGADLVVMLLDLQTGGLLERADVLNDVKQLVLAAMELSIEMGHVLEQQACVHTVLVLAREARAEAKKDAGLYGACLAAALTTTARTISVRRHGEDSTPLHHPPRAQPCPN